MAKNTQAFWEMLGSRLGGTIPSALMGIETYNLIHLAIEITVGMGTV